MEAMPPTRRVSVRPYASGDRWVLEKTLGASSEMEHLNGPESIEQIQRRHERFLAMSADRRAGCMYTIMVGPSAAGSVGYWETDWEGEKAWETGWFVLPEFQGLGGRNSGDEAVDSDSKRDVEPQIPRRISFD